MINSLSKDSHMTQASRHPISAHPLEGFLCKSAPRTAIVNKSDIFVSKPAAISFSGLSSSTIANSEALRGVINRTREIAGPKHKEVVKLIKEAVSHLMSSDPNKSQPVGKVASFLETEKEVLTSIIDDARRLTKEDNIIWIKDQKNPKEKIKKMVKDPNDPSKEIVEYRLTPEEIEEEARKSIGVAAEVFPSVEKPNKFFLNKFVHQTLEFAAKNNVAFSAAYALLLTCLLRPASIMALPGNKKSKDDKKYASAHSIASGVIGYAVTTAISNPVVDGLKKVLDDPRAYLKKNGAYIEASKKAADCTSTWITRTIDIGVAPVKAMMTISLIPPILKYVFGWEKKSSSSSETKGQSPVDNYALINFKSADLADKKVFQSFKGVA